MQLVDFNFCRNIDFFRLANKGFMQPVQLKLAFRLVIIDSSLVAD